MATPPKIGGNNYRQLVMRGINSNRLARTALRKVLDEKVNSTLRAQFIAEAAHALGENLDALMMLNEYANSKEQEE